MTRRTLGSLLVAGFLMGLAPVWGEVPDFLANREEFDPSVTADLDCGVYFGGAKNIGQMHFRFEQAPAGSGAVYRAEMSGSMAVGPNKFSGSEEYHLAADFSRIWSRSTEEEVEGSAPPKKKTHEIRREDGHWVRVTTTKSGDDEEEKESEISVQGADHSELGIIVLVVRAIDPLAAGSFELAGVKWEDDEEPVHEKITVTISEAAEHDFRGSKVQAHEIRVEREKKGDTTTILVTPDHKVLSLAPSDAPVSMVAGSEEEIASDIEVASGPAGEGADSPRGAVEVYMRLISGERETSDLDAVMDWEAIHAELSNLDPQVGSMTPQVLAGVMKQQFEGQKGAATKEQMDVVIPMLKVEIEGDEASVTMPGKEEDPFRLRKTDTGWKITHFPH